MVVVQCCSRKFIGGNMHLNMSLFASKFQTYIFNLAVLYVMFVVPYFSLQNVSLSCPTAYIYSLTSSSCSWPEQCVCLFLSVLLQYMYFLPCACCILSVSLKMFSWHNAAFTLWLYGTNVKPSLLMHLTCLSIETAPFWHGTQASTSLWLKLGSLSSTQSSLSLPHSAMLCSVHNPSVIGLIKFHQYQGTKLTSHAKIN